MSPAKFFDYCQRRQPGGTLVRPHCRCSPNPNRWGKAWLIIIHGEVRITFFDPSYLQLNFALESSANATSAALRTAAKGCSRSALTLWLRRRFHGTVSSTET